MSALKRILLYLYTRRLLPAWLVRAAFRLLPGLKGA
jgi:hypothetical protein